MNTSIITKTGLNFLDLLQLDYSTFVDLKEMVEKDDIKEASMINTNFRDK